MIDPSGHRLRTHPITTRARPRVGKENAVPLSAGTSLHDCTHGYNCRDCTLAPPPLKPRCRNNKLSPRLCFLYLSIPGAFPAPLPATLAARFRSQPSSRHCASPAPPVVLIRHNVHARAPRGNGPLPLVDERHVVAPGAVGHAGYASGFLFSRRVVNKLSDNVFTLPPVP